MRVVAEINVYFTMSNLKTNCSQQHLITMPNLKNNIEFVDSLEKIYSADKVK